MAQRETWARWRQGIAGMALAVGALASAAISARAVAQEANPPADPVTPPATQRLVFAQYYYSFQGDPRKPVPFRGVRDAQGRTVLTDHPWEGTGPWLSYDRAQWHKNQFQMMTAGGVDVALAVFRGDSSSRHSYAIKGLDAMVQGLKELRGEGLVAFTQDREFPQIGMALDLGGLSEQYGGPVDLKTPDVQRSLYGMIRDFYLHVPEEFRATVQLPAARRTASGPAGSANQAQGAAYIVRLFSDAAVKAADASVLSYVNRRFAQEFGAHLIWVGTPALQEKIGGLDAVAPFPAAPNPAAIQKGAWLSSGSAGPGYDNTSQGGTAVITPRANGQHAVMEFRRILTAAPDWVFLDSWNGFGQGSDISPSLEYGLLYRDLIRGALLQFKGNQTYAAQIVNTTMPRVIQTGAIYQVDATVANVGTADWDPFSLAAVSYRWLKNGKPVASKDPYPRVSISSLSHGDTRSYLIGVSAIADGQPLSPGEYEIEFNMNRAQGNELVWFDQSYTGAYRMAVTVAKLPSTRPYWVNSTMPSLTEAGATYPVQVRLRNDGSEAWRQGGLTVGYRWRKISSYLKSGAADQDVVVGEGKGSVIDADVNPGRLVTVEVPVSTVGTDGKPLPVWTPADDWTYVLEWNVSTGGKPAADATYREAVAVLDRDPGASFIGCNLPGELLAGRTQKVTVGLRNVGPEEWKKDQDKIVVHWYYMDGTEASWNDASMPLTEDIPPFSRVRIQRDPKKTFKLSAPVEVPAEPKKGKKGEKPAPPVEVVTRDAVLRDVPVQVPYYFGPMFCVFDFMRDGKMASTSGASKGNDILVIPVNIAGVAFTPLALNQLYNVDGLSQDLDRADGNIDGRGNTLPAEFMPPYVQRPAVGGDQGDLVNLYPSGLWSTPQNSLRSSRACFLYPKKESGLPNMAQASGQALPVVPVARQAVHVLAVCTEEEVGGDFTLTYSDGTTEKKHVDFTYWMDAPKHGERIGFSVAHHHTATSDEPKRVYVDHYEVPANPLKLLISVELPRLPALKVIAMTLESANVGAQKQQ